MKQILRTDVINIIYHYRMKFISNDQLIGSLDYETQNLESEIFDKITYELIGCSNGFLTEFYLTLTGEKVEVVGESPKLFSCPCCGFQTLSEIYDVQKGTGYDICRYCQWEDDGTVDVNKSSSVNRGSISDYRQHILENSNFFYKGKWLR